MSIEIKTQLANLYAQKGELLTEMEIMEVQLRRINQQIGQVKNALVQENKEDIPENKKKK